MRHHSGLRSISLCALALSSVPASAEEADGSRIIVTASPMIEAAAARVQRTPGGVDVVAADAFEDKVAVSLRDALTFSPGVYTQPRFGQEVRISIRGSGLSRGFHMRGLTLLQDGIPLNLADDNGDFQELDPQVFQHIEVYRGGNALRLGGSTLGGAINAVTPTGRSAPGVELRVDGGSSLQRQCRGQDQRHHRNPLLRQRPEYSSEAVRVAVRKIGADQSDQGHFRW